MFSIFDRKMAPCCGLSLYKTQISLGNPILKKMSLMIFLEGDAAPNFFACRWYIYGKQSLAPPRQLFYREMAPFPKASKPSYLQNCNSVLISTKMLICLQYFTCIKRRRCRSHIYQSHVTIFYKQMALSFFAIIWYGYSLWSYLDNFFCLRHICFIRMRQWPYILKIDQSVHVHVSCWFFTSRWRFYISQMQMAIQYTFLPKS